MVLLLASALELPLRERNAMLASAGFAPAYSIGDLDAERMRPVRRALEWTLRQAEPFPAVVLDRHWNVRSTNRAAERLFALLLDAPPSSDPPNVIRLMLDPAGLRPRVTNWESAIAMLADRVRREALERVMDAPTASLLDALREACGAARGQVTERVPCIPIHFAVGDLALRFFSTVTVLGTAADVTAQELRIECFFPEDDETEAECRRRFTDSGPAL